jgi:protein-arginine kinase activator protein McsA
MTEEQIEKLAEIIFQKLLTRQSEFDKQFIEQLKESKGDFEIEVRSPYEESTFGLSEKEKLEEEILGLSKLLSQYEDNEEYEKAVVARDTLTKLMKKLNEL